MAGLPDVPVGTWLHLCEHDWYSLPGMLSQHTVTVRVMAVHPHDTADTALVRAHLTECTLPSHLCGRGWCVELVVRVDAIRRELAAR